MKRSISSPNRSSLSSGRQHPGPEELEPRPSVALSFQQLELVDEALHAAVAPLFRESRPYRVEVFSQAGGETLQRSGTGLLGVLQPPLQIFSFEPPDHLGELLRQLSRVGEALVSLAKPPQIRFLLFVQLFFVAHEQRGHVLRGGREPRHGTLPRSHPAAWDRSKAKGRSPVAWELRPHARSRWGRHVGKP